MSISRTPVEAGRTSVPRGRRRRRGRSRGDRGGAACTCPRRPTSAPSPLPGTRGPNHAPAIETDEQCPASRGVEASGQGGRSGVPARAPARGARRARAQATGGLHLGGSRLQTEAAPRPHSDATAGTRPQAHDRRARLTRGAHSSKKEMTSVGRRVLRRRAPYTIATAPAGRDTGGLRPPPLISSPVNAPPTATAVREPTLGNDTDSNLFSFYL